MDKLALLRKVNERLPSVAEQLIGRWGTPELDSYIEQIIHDAPRSGLGLTPDLIDAMRELRATHLAEFPKFAAITPEAVAARLADNPDFRLINGRFPHIGAQIVATWGRRAFHWYIDSLFNDKKRLDRKGFPEDVVMAIFRLTQIHDEENPGSVEVSKNIWDSHDEHGLRLL